jgi:hypothetical protein
MSSRLIGTISHSTTPHACPCSSSHAFTLQSLQALVAKDSGAALWQCTDDLFKWVATPLLRVGGLLLLHHAQGVCRLQAHMAQELHDIIANISTTIAGEAHQPPAQSSPTLR